MRALQYGNTATVQADIGDGPNVGVSFSVSNPQVASVNSSGLVTLLADPTSAVNFSVIVKQTSTGINVGSADFVAVPASVPPKRVALLNRAYDPTLGNPVGGSITLTKVFSNTFNEYVLRLDFESPTDSIMGITSLTLDLRSMDNQVVKANKLDAIWLNSPQYYAGINWDKTYMATLVATTGDKFTKTLTDTYSDLEGGTGWNVSGWNTRGYGL